MKNLGKFCEIYGDTISNRIIEYLMENQDIEFSIGDMAKDIDISKPKAYDLIKEFERKKYVTKSRIIGKTQLYKLDKHNKIVKIYLRNFQECLNLVFDEYKPFSTTPSINQKREQIDNLFNLKFKIVGVGGAGNNIISNLFEIGVSGAELIAVNTDYQHLNLTKADRKILIGKKNTKGLGCGGFIQIGAESVYEQSNQIKEVLRGSELVIICAGMGGGTGTGASPIIAEIAKEVGAMVLSVITMPFKIERARTDKAIFGLEQLEKHSNTLIILDNNRLINIAGHVPINQAFAIMNKIISNMIKSTIEIVTLPALVNLDFYDLKSVIGQGGISGIGIGISNKENKVEEVVKVALSNLLFQGEFKTAKGVLIDIVGDSKLTLDKVSRIGELVTESLNPETNVIWGARIDENMKEKLSVYILVTGMDNPYIYKPTNEKEKAITQGYEVDLVNYFRVK